MQIEASLTDLFAIIPYVALSTWALLVAGAFAIAMSLGASGRYHPWGVALFLMLAVYFFALAITGGSVPLIPRRQLAVPIRAVAVGVLVLGYGWIILWARAHIVIRRGERVEHGKT
jgi:hypothetical protein